MNKKVLFFAVVLSVTFMAMNTESFSAETNAVPAPAKTVAAPAQAAAQTPAPVQAAAPAPAQAPAQAAAPVTTKAPAKVAVPTANTKVNYGTTASTNRTSRPRVGLGFDGIPFNGSHREATRIRRSYRGR